jgi:uncharacterized protein YjbI with pentapeptide repeats
MRGVNLQGANLRGADLATANLSVLKITRHHGFINSTNPDDLKKSGKPYETSKHADLTGADLTDADVTGTIFTGATMPDGSIHN